MLPVQANLRGGIASPRSPSPVKNMVRRRLTALDVPRPKGSFVTVDVGPATAAPARRRSALPRGFPDFAAPSATRSRNMAAMRGQDTAPERQVRRALHAAGFRFRLHSKDVPGRPDLLLPRYRRAVLVHGCFWHAHGCARAPFPKSNQAYWTAKFAMNRARDARVQAALAAAGWRVTVLWQCQLDEDIAALLATLRAERAAGPRTTRSARPD